MVEIRMRHDNIDTMVVAIWDPLTIEEAREIAQLVKKTYPDKEVKMVNQHEEII
jgi:hypothetical protein